MLQSRVISEASSTFVSIREFMVVNRACFQIQGFIFRLRLYFKWAIPFSGFATTSSRANSIRSRCATTWLTTLPSGGYSAAPLPSSPETGLTSHCESDKLSLLSLVRMTLTRNNHCERGFRRICRHFSSSLAILTWLATATLAHPGNLGTFNMLFLTKSGNYPEKISLVLFISGLDTNLNLMLLD